MALDKLVDSSQLDADLASVANAIRTKGGTSAQLQFPQGFVDAVQAIETGGDPNESFRKLFSNSLTEYIDPELTSITAAISLPSHLVTFKCHNVTRLTVATFNNSYVQYLAFPKVSDANGGYMFRGQRLKGIDLVLYRLAANSFANCSALETIVFRRTESPVTIASTNVFNSSRFANGGAGGTIYIPKVLYDHLGDGSSLDYKAATNWSTVDGWGTITWAQIEGSIYETQYADGTPIPTT